MAYEQQYTEAKGNKKIFIFLMHRKYKALKKASIDRAFYRCRKRCVIKKPVLEATINESINIFTEMPRIRQLKIMDMLKYKIKITKSFLYKEGYTKEEVEALEAKGVKIYV